MSSEAELRQYARIAAVGAGIDPDIYERQINQESGFNPNAGPSPAGACGIAQIVPASHPGINVWDPQASLMYGAALMADALRKYGGSYALALASYNAGPNAVAKYRWVPPYPETQRYLMNIIGGDWRSKEVHIYDPSTPDEPQQQSWTCSIRSATWLLKSLNIATDAAEMQELMVDYDHIVSPEDGLKDATGHGLRDFLIARWGLAAQSTGVISWADLKAMAGKKPVLIGGRAWNHWVAVRTDVGDGSLYIMNPAKGYMNVTNTLDEEDFNRLGPFSAVWVEPNPSNQPAHSYRVENTDGQGVNIRAEPNASSKRLGGLKEGDHVLADPHAWRRVTTADGTTGWVAEEFLKEIA